MAIRAMFCNRIPMRYKYGKERGEKHDLNKHRKF